MTPDLLERLRLLEAWRKPGGPTPNDKMPNTYKTVKEAADALETLMEHAEAMAKAIEHEGYRSTRLQGVHANFRAAFPGEG